MPTRSLTLTRTAQSTTNVQNRSFFRFTVTVSANTNIDKEVFRFLRRPKDPLNEAGTQEDVFSGICTPEEIVSLPLNNPSSESFPPWCRKNSVDLIFSSEADADAAWELIQQDVESLLDAFKKMDTLSSSQTVVISV